jgi:flagellar protein FliJ
MKKFRFSLNTLIKIREQQVEHAQNNLREANLYMQEIANKLEILKNLFENHQRTLREKQHQELQTASLEKYQDYTLLLKSKIHDYVKLAQEAKQFVDKRRSEIVITRKSLRIIEILKEKKYMEWEINYSREENKLADDFSTMHFSRKKRE